MTACSGSGCERWSTAAQHACGTPCNKKGEHDDDWPREQLLKRELSEGACDRRHQLLRIVGDTIFEHEFDVAHVRDVGRWVAPQDNEVSLHAFSNGSDGAILEESRAIRRGDRDGLFGAESAGH